MACNMRQQLNPKLGGTWIGIFLWPQQHTQPHDNDSSTTWVLDDARTGYSRPDMSDEAFKLRQCS